MKLLLDLGNSRCKAAFANGDTITHQALLCDKESRLATVETLLREKKKFETGGYLFCVG